MNTKSLIWNRIRPHIYVFAFFLALSFLFFLPKFEGKQIIQGDVEKYIEMSQEAREYYEKEGVGTSWTGSMFSGMPTYTITTQGGPANILDYIEKPVKALGGSDVGVVFLSLVSCYLLLLFLGVNIPLAMLGAIAFAFSSYSIIILQAGHITKAWAMAYMPFILIGFILVLRQKYLAGVLIFATSLALQLKNNHPQITYYLALFCGIVYLGYIINCFKQKHGRAVYISLATLIAGILIAFLCNFGHLYANYELSKESIRGRSELSHQVDGKTDKSSGLDKDYAFSWSYGKAETFTLLIPNFYGGASAGTLKDDSHLAKEMHKQGYMVPDPLQSYLYWGDQPFTAGPVYFGAIICMLFVFSLFVIKHPLKWWIVGGMVFFVFLSWGRNFDAFNTFLFHYLPFYNKFRTVSMALVIPQLVFALMSVWGLWELKQHKTETRQMLHALYYSVIITGGLCLFFALFAPMSFRSILDIQYQMPDWYMNALVLDREDLLSADAYRSILFILLGGSCLYLYIRSNKPSRFLPYVLMVLVLIDLWGIAKRYLNESHYTKTPVKQEKRIPSPVDQFILKDKDLSYRVLPLQDPFINSTPSYFHKNIGGYNAAKLRRYQDLIELKLEPEYRHIINVLSKATSEADIDSVLQHCPMLNMLNMRYLIIDQKHAPLRNPYAYGNAWFVSKVQIVDDANEEMKRLGEIDVRKVALVDKRFSSIICDGQYAVDSLAEVKMVEYKPDRLAYKYKTSHEGVILFSEVYYPHGWKAAIDGEMIEHFRANWLLRGIKVPAGEHTISFYFKPDVYILGRWITTTCSGLLFLSLLIGAGVYLNREYKKMKDK